MVVRIELQRARDRIEHLRGGVDVASLLEARVPGDAETGELSDLLPAKARSAPATQRTKADLLGPDALSTAAEEGAQLAPAQIIAVPLRQIDCRRALRDDLGSRHE